MANHGQIAFAESLSKAFELAQEVEKHLPPMLSCDKARRAKESDVCRNAKNFGKVKGYKRG